LVLTRPKTTGFFTLLLSIIVEFISYQQYQIGKNDEQSLINSYPTTLTLAITINDGESKIQIQLVSYYNVILQCNSYKKSKNQNIERKNYFKRSSK
jgi:hypothetical protein